MPTHTNLQRDILISNLEEQLQKGAKEVCGKSLSRCSNREVYKILLKVTNDLLAVTESCQGEKKLYFISMEFLIGKLLSNNLINLRI